MNWLPDFEADPDVLRRHLAAWFIENRRSLPWRENPEPYSIWLSEVILQQTRVEQGLPYFFRFLERFPTVEDLAGASEDDVLRLWEGLGYYSRGRNLHRAAQFVMEERAGKLPDTYEDWLALPGVGPYTAAAISSIAFGEKQAVLDGNVIRVLSRLLALDEVHTTSSARRKLMMAAEALLDHDNPGRHNEAMMELGALVCSPTSPSCPQCPFREGCRASKRGQMTDFPVRKPKKAVPHHDIAVAIIRDSQERIFIQQRDRNAMLGGLWEFPGGKVEAGESAKDACIREVREEIGLDVLPIRKLAEIDHAYSHFRITLHAFECLPTSQQEPETDSPTTWIAREAFSDYAFPRANRRLLDLLGQDSSF